VRALALGTPAAKAGDTTGAVLQAYTIYTTALKNSGGDHTKAVAMLQQAINPPKPAQESAQTMSAQTSAQAAQKPVVSMSQAIPAAQKAPPTVLEALNPSGNASLNGVLQPRARAIESLATQLKKAQDDLAKAAQGSPQAAIAQAQSVQAIRNAINKQLEDMTPQQAAQVTRAAGL
jgi:hypothetical protein